MHFLLVFVFFFLLFLICFDFHFLSFVVLVSFFGKERENMKLGGKGGWENL